MAEAFSCICAETMAKRLDGRNGLRLDRCLALWVQYVPKKSQLALIAKVKLHGFLGNYLPLFSVERLLLVLTTRVSRNSLVEARTDLWLRMRC